MAVDSGEPVLGTSATLTCGRGFVHRSRRGSCGKTARVTCQASSRHHKPNWVHMEGGGDLSVGCTAGKDGSFRAGSGI